MTINGKKATDKSRRDALSLWRKVMDDRTINRHVSIEYTGQQVRVNFDTKEEQLAFMRELIEG
jgi:hypothetical protein